MKQLSACCSRFTRHTPQHRLLQLMVTVLLLGCSIIKSQAAAAGPVTLIVEYKKDAVTSAAAAADSVSAAAVASAVKDAAAVAVAAADDRGAPAHKKVAIAAMASEAATTIPALAAITSAVSVAAVSSGIEVVGHTSYGTVIKGAAIKTKTARDADLLKQQLESNPAVSRVWLAGARQLVKPVVPSNLTAAGAPTAKPAAAAAAQRAVDTATATTGNTASTGLGRVARIASSELDGSGTLICVVDTGINYKNPLYGSCTDINVPRGTCKVSTGYNFVGSNYNGQLNGPSAQPDSEPIDCMGHGSMVASVAATANGVAPGALLGSYRVFGCSGFATDDIIIAAIDRAVRDGCDIINLSLASGSGYADSSVYTTVMDNALSKGVLVVKAAGNQGDDGPFTADVFTAVGSIAAASVGDDVNGAPLDSNLVASGFSSYGPNPSLELVPHVSAPGAYISVVTMYGTSYRASGTSFSAPYISGVLALWLQHHHQQAAASGRPAAAGTIDQAAALAGLVNTAKGVRAEGNRQYLEPLAKTGAGVIQVDAFINNQLRVSPTLISLPSLLTEPTTATITINWEGPPAHSRDAEVTYELEHDPAASMSVSNGWYGTHASIHYVYEAADVSFEQRRVAVNTAIKKPVRLKVTFSLPPALAQESLLYSGLIRLQPTDSSLPAVVVPYQGYTKTWSNLRVLAKPRSNLDANAARKLRQLQNALCYAPRSTPMIINSIQDILSKVPDVCEGGLATSPSDVLNVSLAVLQESPECSLRVTVVPETPLHTLFVDVLDASGEYLGSTPPLDTSSGSSLTSPKEVCSFCLHFNGSYKDKRGALQWLRPGQTYRLRANLRGPLAAADEALGRRPRKTQVDIRGKFRIMT